MVRSSPLRRQRKTSKEERICAICSQGFKKAEHLARHVRSHTKEKPFECEACGKAYARSDTLSRHSKSHHGAARASSEPEAQQPWVDDEVLAGVDEGMQSQRAHTTDFIQPRAQMAPDVAAGTGQVALTGMGALSVDGHSPGMSGGTSASIYTSNETPATTKFSGEMDTALDDQSNPLSSLWDESLDMDWTSWLAGADFDLNSVNLSLTNVFESVPDHAANASPEPLNSAHAHDMAHQSKKTRVQRKWHTYIDKSSSGPTTPRALQERSSADRLHRHELEESLRPRVQNGNLPSIKFLDLCTQAFFNYFHPIFPLIHAPTFRPCTQNAMLLLSICSIGSLFLGSPRATVHGISMFERVNKAILASWDSYVSCSVSLSMMALQAAMIGQTFGLLVGRPKDLVGIDLFHGSVISWARMARIFRVEDEPLPRVRNMAGEALNSAWHAWAAREVKIRILYGLHIHDTELAKIHHHEPTLRHPVDRLPQLSSEELFTAPNANAWKVLVLQAQAAQPTPLEAPQSRPGFAPMHAATNKFQLLTALESLCAMTHEGRCSASRWRITAQEGHALLTQWYEAFNAAPGPRASDPFCSMILWHEAFMDLHADFDALECACGRDGEQAAERYLAYAQAWAESADAVRCLLHSTLVQRHFEAMRVACEPAIHVPTALYRCGIAWACYTLFGRGLEAPRASAFPELQMLGLDGSRLFAEVTRGIRWGRPESGPLFKVVDYLQRINHWTVAHRFASTLLLLVEEAQDLF